MPPADALRRNIKETVRTLFMHIFWHLRPHHCVHPPHHCLANSRTWHDLALTFPGLSTTKLVFPAHSRSWKFNKHNSRTFQEAWAECAGSQSSRAHKTRNRARWLSSHWPGPEHPSRTHTHPFNGPLSRTTRTSQYQKGRTNLDFTEARDSEWHWHQLGHMQLCISLQTR